MWEHFIGIISFKERILELHDQEYRYLGMAELTDFTHKEIKSKLNSKNLIKTIKTRGSCCNVMLYNTKAVISTLERKTNI